jgi:HPt (histidine-containing phosphotransfer) domain-containing protein
MARVMDDEDLARLVIDGFLEDAPRLMVALGDCLRTGDAQGAIREAHTIKGASATVGGETMRLVAQEIEAAALAGDLDAVRARLPHLDAAFAGLRQEMQESAGQTGADAASRT